MITIQVQLVDHMTKEPVGGADVTMTLKVVPRWQEYRSPAPEATANYPEVVIVSDNPVDIFSGRATSLGFNTFMTSFEIDHHVFEGVVEEKYEGPDYYDSTLWGKIGQRDRINPNLIVEVGVAVAGLSQTSTISGINMRLTGPDYSWTTAVVHIDFAKAIVGHTTSEKALLWFNWHGTARAGRYFCEVESLDTPDQRRIFPVEFGDPDPAQAVVVPVDSLRPATKYRYLLRLLEGGAGPADSGRILASGEFTTAPEPASSDTLSFVFGSCHFPAILGQGFEPGRWKELDRWENLARRRDYDLMVLMGDQIYGDDIDHLGNDWFERYANRYHQMRAYWPMREVLRRTPTYMIFDDHEVADDWGSDPDFSRLEPGREDRALDAYRAFQHSHNPGGQKPTGPFYYPFRWGPAAFFVLDCRSQRGISASHPMLGDDQFRALQHWARNEARQADVIFVVATVPMAFLPTEEVRRLIKELEKKGEALKGALKGFVLAGPLGAAVGYYVGPRIAGKKLAKQDHARLTELVFNCVS